MIEKIESLKRRYTKLYETRGISQDDLNNIQHILGIVLPESFCKISEFYEGGAMGPHSIFSLKRTNNNYNIIDQTLCLRQSVGLPSRYIALNIQDEGFITMETKSTPSEKAPVIYCSIEDAYNLAEGKPLQYNPTIFESFTDFFEYLLNQEEDERKIEDQQA